MEDAPVDHRGRSRPLYPHRTGRPQSTSRTSRVLLGLFPGLRLLASDDGRKGIPVALLGLATVAAAVFLFNSLEMTAELLERIDASPRFLSGQLGLIWLMALIFEVLRYRSSGHTRPPTAPRAFATLCLPAALMMVGTATYARVWPELHQALFAAAAIVFFGCIPAVGFTLTDLVLPPSSGRRSIERTGLIGWMAGTTLIVVWFFVVPHPGWSRSAWYAGWDLLAELLR